MENIPLKIMVIEGKQIIKILRVIPSHLDGKKCILEMKKEAESLGIRGNWRQMEWIGWYLEETSRKLLIDNIGGSIGPTIRTSDGGKVSFDYMNKEVWDIKSHTIIDGDEACILNDKEAIFNIIQNYGKIGFIIFMCNVKYDTTDKFRIWHDKLKGEVSSYCLNNKLRGAEHRRRKTACDISRILIIEFKSFGDLENGINAGWVKKFQKDLRNSNGNPRREKISLLLSKIPKEYVTYVHIF